MAENCGNCRFWYADGDGQCRRSPPVIDFEDGVSSVFPPTSESDWCGEWEISAKADEPRRKKIRAELMAELKTVYG